MELIIGPANIETFLLKLIISYLKIEERGKIKLISLSEPALKAIELGKLALKTPSLVTEKSEVLTETFEIARYLLSLQPTWTSFFLGESKEEKEDITNIKIHYKGGKELRKYLQKHLESRTFFVGHHLTFADFFMFTQLYDNVVEMTDEQKIQYNNLFRWYKHIQNLPEIRLFLQSQNRILVSDPEIKLTFLEAKKKKNKKE